MKKSRTGLAILFLAFLVVCFVVAVALISTVSEGDKDGSSWAEVLDFGNKIGVINLEGTITSSDETLKQLRKFRKKSSVRAIILRINSPGGTVAPAQEIYREIMKVKKKKPVVVSMETVAASAAYYISSSADDIVCSQGTITGSIGVIMMLPDMHKIIEKIGLGMNVIKAGKYKDIGSAVRPLTDEEKSILETFAAEIHEQFISDVAEGRKGKIEKENLRSIADGRFFTGQKAKELGLVDTIGNFYDAVTVAKKLANVKGEPELVYPKKKWDYLDMLVESTAGAVNRVTERIRLVQPGVPSIR
jgi:protease IV